MTESFCLTLNINLNRSTSQHRGLWLKDSLNDDCRRHCRWPVGLNEEVTIKCMICARCSVYTGY